MLLNFTLMLKFSFFNYKTVIFSLTFCKLFHNLFRNYGRAPSVVTIFLKDYNRRPESFVVNCVRIFLYK